LPAGCRPGNYHGVIPAVILTVALGLTRTGGPCDPAPATGIHPSGDLYCIPLHPAAGLDGARGTATLDWIPGPFTVAVTPDGRHRYALTLTVEGLPEPATLGPYSHYVAWAVTPVFDTVVRLGRITNGRTTLGEISLDRFLVLVSAEASATPPERTGRLVLRGESASNRMRPPDVTEFVIGAAPRGSPDHAHHGEPDSLGWTMVPMPADLQMLPREMLFRPGVRAYLPTGTAATPDARPREVVPLADGDTLELEAGLVRRQVAGRSFVMYGFNGQYPGPLLVVTQATEITVVFRNRLDQPSTVHWHGLRLDNRFDGVPGLTQDRRWRPATTSPTDCTSRDAGIYWYHPHVREDIQQDLGLYGNILVRSPHPDAWSPAHREEILILDDLLVGDDGLVPYGLEEPTHALMGRFGNVMLVNGEPDWRTTARPGEVRPILPDQRRPTRAPSTCPSPARA
jgi:hypothetical protein